MKTVCRIPTLKYYIVSIFLYSALTLSPVQAETIGCTAITSLPYTISTQGVYCFTGNLSTSINSGAAIDIQTNNVTLDLNGYKLGGLGAGDSTNTAGIFAIARKNITIKNGIVRGFRYGIWIDGDYPFTNSSGNVVNNILADQNTAVGIQVEGLGNTVQNNTVVDTGGSTMQGDAYGIVVYGPGTKVINNDISQTIAAPLWGAYGLSLTYADYSAVSNNTVTDTIDDSSYSYAIFITSSTGVFVRNNQLANADYGLFFGSSSGKYFNNLTFDVSTPFYGGTAIGSNNN